MPITAALLAILLLGLATAATAGPDAGAEAETDAESASVEAITRPKVSPNDTRDYRALTLDNGLRVLLVSDPDADKAAVSLNVEVGSAQDPDDLHGLAHYLEHMLFLGTEPYPEADAYQGYLSRHGGRHNAFTASRNTNYFFSIEPDALPGALERFSRFFVSPLFNADRLESERQVVHSEYVARRRDERRRRNSVLDELLNPEHPFTGFSVGNQQTLADRPDGEPSLRERIIDFYQQHYGASVMQLALVAPQPLDRLERLVTENFADVPDRGLEPPVIDVELVATERLPAAAELASLRDERSLSFYFPIPDPISDYRHKPADYIANLLGHEGKGSLLSVLRDADWANGLSAGVGLRDGQHALFVVDISLTPEGAKHIDRIQASLFAAIELIASQGIDDWRYAEQAKLAEQSFRFQQHGSALQSAMRLALNLSDFPLEDVLYAPYRMDGLERQQVADRLALLTPERMLRLYSGPEVKGEQTTPWFDTRWSAVDPSQGDAEPLPGLALPEPNPYIAEDLTLLDGDGTTPTRRIATPDADFWHLQDNSFSTPKVEWRLSLQHPDSGDSARQAALARLLAGWLNDSLNDELYPARLAGQSFNAYAHGRGITLSFSGWRDRQAPLMQRVIEQLQRAAIEPQRMMRVLDRLQRGWRNAPRDTLYSQANSALTEALIAPRWSSEALLSASEDIDLESLEHFRDDFLARLHLEAMAIGNIDAASAVDIAESLIERLSPAAGADAIPELTPLRATASLGRLTPDSERDESLVLRYLQGQDRSTDSQATLMLIGKIMETPFYQQLRTEQQLGYVVNAGYQPLLDAPGISMLVQSPDTPSATIDARIDDFIGAFSAQLDALDAQTLAPWQSAVRQNLLQRDTSLSGKANRLWYALALGDTDFDRRERLAERVLEVSADGLRSAWEGLLERPAVTVAHDPGDAPSDIMALKAGLEPLPKG
ncbi:MAG TPA: insulinase family protein [Halomonas sp.]|nr:insulinase family protein [Halomonas sp.]